MMASAGWVKLKVPNSSNRHITRSRLMLRLLGVHFPHTKGSDLSRLVPDWQVAQALVEPVPLTTARLVQPGYRAGSVPQSHEATMRPRRAHPNDRPEIGGTLGSHGAAPRPPLEPALILVPQVLRLAEPDAPGLPQLGPPSFVLSCSSARSTCGGSSDG